MKIFKYEVSVEIEMPVGATILSVQMQGGTAQLWALVDPYAGTERRRFAVIGTGWDIPDHHVYLGTWQDGPFVWHLFEATP